MNLSDFIQSKILLPEDLEKKALQLKEGGKTIATLNGSFDLMHAGHLTILYEAKAQADILIVALNSDTSIQKYKSPLRPIIPLTYRLQMMASIAFVDYVTFYEETTPMNFIEKVKPHVHVNGADYGMNCIEAPTVKAIGARLHLVSIVPGLSTSQIIQRVLTQCA